jgi:hypothetical protein
MLYTELDVHVRASLDDKGNHKFIGNCQFSQPKGLPICLDNREIGVVVLNIFVQDAQSVVPV